MLLVVIVAGSAAQQGNEVAQWEELELQDNICGGTYTGLHDCSIPLGRICSTAHLVVVQAFQGRLMKQPSVHAYPCPSRDAWVAGHLQHAACHEKAEEK